MRVGAAACSPAWEAEAAAWGHAARNDGSWLRRRNDGRRLWWRHDGIVLWHGLRRQLRWWLYGQLRQLRHGRWYGQLWR